MKNTEYHIDINADLGEGIGNDEQIMPLISSCSIACGGHFGNKESIKNTIQLAKKYRVKIGAHPSFPDRDNFGRKLLTLTKRKLQETISAQLNLFLEVCHSEDIEMHHVKLHGALYNYAAKDAPTADAIVEAILETQIRPILYVPPNSILAEKAKNLLPLWYEAFIDRRYHNDGTLVSRMLEDAVILDNKSAWNQLKQLVVKGSVNTIEGQEIPLQADTFCIHGDTPQALGILKFIHQSMPAHGIKLS